MKIIVFYLVVIGIACCIPSDDTTSNTKYVMENGAYIVGADMNEIVLVNNPNATDVTYDELISFVKLDKTDKILYVDEVFVCADFAELLHNNAEAYGIRSAYVTVSFQNDKIGHAFNAFTTNDKGIIYIDSTGYKEITPCSADRIIGVEVGKPMWYYKVTKCDGYYSVPFVADKVKSMTVTW